MAVASPFLSISQAWLKIPMLTARIREWAKALFTRKSFLKRIEPSMICVTSIGKRSTKGFCVFWHEKGRHRKASFLKK